MDNVAAAAPTTRRRGNIDSSGCSRRGEVGRSEESGAVPEYRSAPSYYRYHCHYHYYFTIITIINVTIQLIVYYVLFVFFSRSLCSLLAMMISVARRWTRPKVSGGFQSCTSVPWIKQGIPSLILYLFLESWRIFFRISREFPRIPVMVGNHGST